MSRRRKTKIGGQFSWRLREMMESDPFRVLSRAGHLGLARLEIELCSNGGTNNGALIVPFADFEKFGIERESISPMIREVVALGFVRITHRGMGGNAEYRIPNKYRLTYKDTEREKPTDDWRAIKTREEALQVAKTARKAKDVNAVTRSKNNAKKQITGAEKPHASGRTTHPDNGQVPGRKTHPLARGGKPTPLSISPVCCRRSRVAKRAPQSCRKRTNESPVSDCSAQSAGTATAAGSPPIDPAKLITGLADAFSGAALHPAR